MADKEKSEPRRARYSVGYSPEAGGATLETDTGDVLICVCGGVITTIDADGRVSAALVEAAGMLLDREAERELEKIKASLGSFAGMLQAIGSVVGGGTKIAPKDLHTAVREEVGRETGLPKSCPDCGALMRSGEDKCLVCEMLAEKETGDAQGSAQTESSDR